MSYAYSMRDAYIANAMGYENSLAHVDWKNHKYISKVFKNGQWVYNYGKQAVDKYVTGASAKSRAMNASQKAAQAQKSGNKITANQYGTISRNATAEYNKSLAGRMSQAKRSLNISIANLKTSANTTLTKGKSYFSDLKSRLTTSLSAARSNPVITKASNWIDKYITGATAKKMAQTMANKASDYAKAGKAQEAKISSGLAGTYRDSYNNSLAGRMRSAGKAVKTTYGRASDSVSGAVGAARNAYDTYQTRRQFDADAAERERKRATYSTRNQKSGGSASSKRINNRAIRTAY